MAPFLPPSEVLALAFALQPQRNYRYARPESHELNIRRQPYSRSATSLPLGAAQEASSSTLRDDPTGMAEEDSLFSELCRHLSVGPAGGGLLSLKTNDGGVRGMYVNSAAQEGDVLLSMPLASCLRDDMAPSWMGMGDSSSSEEANEEDGYYISQWPTRLAASLLDLQLRSKAADDDDDDDDGANTGKEMWLTMLPDRTFLRASLPMHWPDEVLSSAKCPALELAVDSVYFSRAGAIADLLGTIKSSGDDCGIDVDGYGEEELDRLCHDALDVVQTRCCNVRRPGGGAATPDGDGPPLRIVAPVFDFFNHGSRRYPRVGCPNAFFALEEESGEEEDESSEGSSSRSEPCLVVRATKDIEPSEEVLIDYGGSAETAWKCLVSYGFVPEYDVDDERNTVELVVDGTFADVGGESVPFDLVEAAAAALEAEEKKGQPSGDVVVGGKGANENPLSPAVALRIAEKASGVASELLIEPDIEVSREEDAYSLSLAASLRKSQHKVLHDWASGLKKFAESFPEK